MITVSVLLCAVLVAQDKPTPKMPLGKATTYISEPIDRDGYVDYETALNDRLGKGITPDKNAVVLLWKAHGPTAASGARMPAEYFKWLGAPEQPEAGDYFIDLATHLKEQLNQDPDKLNDFLVEQDTATKRVWAPAEFPHIASWLRANEKPLAVVSEATKRPEYFFPQVAKRTDNGRESLVATQLWGAAKYRDMASALAARALLRTGEGKYAEAWQDLLACHRLGRHVTRGGTLIEWLAGSWIDRTAISAELAFIDRAKLTSEQIRDCMKDLQNLPQVSQPADKINLAGRFTYLDCAQFVRRGGMITSDLVMKKTAAQGKPNAEEEMALAAIDWESVLQDGNQWYDRLVAALQKPTRHDRDKEFREIDREMSVMKDRIKRMQPVIDKFREGKDPGKQVGKVLGNMLVGLLSPDVRAVQYAIDRAEQMQRSLYLAFALAAYNRDNGRYPPKLEDVALKYIAAIPDDVFTGKPLVYHSFETGYLLYSVGANGRDDQGMGPEDMYSYDDIAVRGGEPERELAFHLQGTWEVLSITVDGEFLPDDETKGRTVVFEGNKMMTKQGKKTDIVTYKLNAGKKPIWFDTTEEKNSPLLGLLHMQGDTLAICTLKSADTRPIEINSEKDSKSIMTLLRRERK